MARSARRAVRRSCAVTLVAASAAAGHPMSERLLVDESPAEWPSTRGTHPGGGDDGHASLGRSSASPRHLHCTGGGFAGSGSTLGRGSRGGSREGLGTPAGARCRHPSPDGLAALRQAIQADPEGFVGSRFDLAWGLATTVHGAAQAP